MAGNGKPDRNWEIWRRYKGGGITDKQLGVEFGISTSRASQIVRKLDRKIRGVLNMDNMMQETRVTIRRKMSDEIRNGTLGVEFVFRNELTFSDKERKRWDRVEPEEYGSMYSPPFPEWPRGWGEQDTSPAKPRKVYTYYKTITPRIGASA